ncbi:SIS domain-containing protein [Fodinibius sp. SL11]|uniref:SIS domain-containing protein n=1 Tax=Fodinibius sp. SL11 TaxID=3425690 RepID=UPI003F883514
MKESQEVLKVFEDADIHTGGEITGQPKLWIDIYKKLKSEKEEILNFFNSENINSPDEVNVILTGAGSSAFIGEITQYAFKKAGFKNAQAIPTTDLVTHFTDLVDTSHPLLLISFGRSGNSPESKATVALANKYCDQVSHLIISCNKNGELAKRADKSNAFAFILPPSAEDQGLAMTGSFSGMVLAASLISNISEIEKLEPIVSKISNIGNYILKHHLDLLSKISNKDFNRIIFLGDGPLLGCARESHLKVQELSDGICLGKFDSFLGFRHGPKAIVNDKSLLIYLLSNDQRVAKYQFDLIEQISLQNLGLHSLAIGNIDDVDKHVDSYIQINQLNELPEIYLPIPYILIAQIIGFLKAKYLGLNPDNPSQNGAISRVVEGVKLYI